MIVHCVTSFSLPLQKMTEVDDATSRVSCSLLFWCQPCKLKEINSTEAGYCDPAITDCKCSYKRDKAKEKKKSCVLR